jgi:hypothetical protein
MSFHEENVPRLETGGGHNYQCRDASGLPPFLKQLLASPPRHGNGVHRWLYCVSRHLHAHRSQQAIVDMLTDAVRSCGRDVPNREIVAAVEDSKANAWQPDGNPCLKTGKGSAFKPVERKPKWPAIDEGKRRNIIAATNFQLSDLIAASPVLSAELDAENFVDLLFPGNPLLCVGKSQVNFTTATREELRGLLSTIPFIVPSPMITREGRRQSDGKLSMHTLENTGPRRYLVTEFDPPKWDSLSVDTQANHGTEDYYYKKCHDEQAALIWHLRQFAPLALVLWSGSKSIHAWWDCQNHDDSVTRPFMCYAASLGADPMTWNRSQFVRLPQGWRAEKQRRQEVYFFNHKAGKRLAQ